MGDVPIRCFTCGKVVANLFEDYTRYCEEGLSPQQACDKLKLSRECCRRMMITHVGTEKYQLMYPTYENNIQYVGVFDEINLENAINEEIDIEDELDDEVDDPDEENEPEWIVGGDEDEAYEDGFEEIEWPE